MSCCPLSELRRGSQARVTGRLRSVTYTPRETVPTLAAELFDGSAAIELVWLGRRRIAGVEPGRRLLVGGRVGGHDGKLGIYHPRYTRRERGWATTAPTRASRRDFASSTANSCSPAWAAGPAWSSRPSRRSS